MKLHKKIILNYKILIEKKSKLINNININNNYEATFLKFLLFSSKKYPKKSLKKI